MKKTFRIKIIRIGSSANVKQRHCWQKYYRYLLSKNTKNLLKCDAFLLSWSLHFTVNWQTLAVFSTEVERLIIHESFRLDDIHESILVSPSVTRPVHSPQTRLWLWSDPKTFTEPLNRTWPPSLLLNPAVVSSEGADSGCMECLILLKCYADNSDVSFTLRFEEAQSLPYLPATAQLGPERAWTIRRGSGYGF